MAFILGQTARGGAKAGFSAMFGIWTGAMVHIIFAVLGLSAILATSALAFTAVKWVGAAYLIWLGIQAWRSNGIHLPEQQCPPKAHSLRIFKQGILVAVLNPKVALFFLAFLPQFVEPGAGPVGAQLFLHGFLIILVAAFIETPIIFLGDRVAGFFRKQTRLTRWFDRGLGTLLIGMGVKLATTERIP